MVYYIPKLIVIFYEIITTKDERIEYGIWSQNMGIIDR